MLAVFTLDVFTLDLQEVRVSVVLVCRVRDLKVWKEGGGKRERKLGSAGLCLERTSFTKIVLFRL